MDRAALQEFLAQADGHIAEAADIIAKHRALIAGSEGNRHDSLQTLLKQSESTQARLLAFREHLLKALADHDRQG
jgi:hypothetical protein